MQYVLYGVTNWRKIKRNDCENKLRLLVTSDAFARPRKQPQNNHNMKKQTSTRVGSTEQKTSDRVNARLAVRLAKFRAWNHIVGRMSAEYTLQELHKEEVNFMNVSFLESTGVTDKSGKEIFEHDILTYTVSCGNESGMVEKDKNGRRVFHAIVVYEAGQFIGKKINGDGGLTFGFPLSVLSKEKIVGNYYQRPDKCFLIS